jgi:hypothetical protein
LLSFFLRDESAAAAVSCRGLAKLAALPSSLWR